MLLAFRKLAVEATILQSQIRLPVLCWESLLWLPARAACLLSFFVAALASSTSAGAHARLQVLFSTQYMDSVLISSVTD